uniref:Uncharacterized protein n=1 Tax=Glossina pallidipes TaxID=7398 RepID=A0A1A9Z0S6_GLOPL
MKKWEYFQGVKGKTPSASDYNELFLVSVSFKRQNQKCDNKEMNSNFQIRLNCIIFMMASSSNQIVWKLKTLELYEAFKDNFEENFCQHLQDLKRIAFVTLSDKHRRAHTEIPYVLYLSSGDRFIYPYLQFSQSQMERFVEKDLDR